MRKKKKVENDNDDEETEDKKKKKKNSNTARYTTCQWSGLWRESCRPKVVREQA